MYGYTASSLTKFLSIITLIVGGIMGIVCGNIFAVQISLYSDPVFNFSLALAIWALTLFASIALYLCCRHFRNQEEANETLDKIARHLNNIEKNTKKED